MGLSHSWPAELVPTRLLCPIQVRIGPCDHFRLGLTGFYQRHSNGDSWTNGAAGAFHHATADKCTAALRHRPDGCLVNPRQNGDKLVATPTAQKIERTQIIDEGVAHRIQHGITSIMAVGIVDIFEMIDVNEKDDEVFGVAIVPVEGLA